MMQRQKPLVLTLMTALITLRMPDASALQVQEPNQKKPTLLSCTLHKGSVQKTLSRKVNLSDFQRLHCVPDLEYFEALDAAPIAEYAKLRMSLRWNTQRTFEFKASVTSGTEQFEAVSGVEVLRTYSPSSMTVSIRNKTATAIFVEGFDINGKAPLDISRLAYVSIPANSGGMIYRVDAVMADPVWPSGKMQINLLVE